MANFLTTMYNTNDPNVEPPLLEEYDAKKVKLQTDMKDPKAVKLEKYRAQLLEFNANLNLHANESKPSNTDVPHVGETLPGTNVKTPLLASVPKVGQTFTGYNGTLDNYGRTFEKYTSEFKVRTADMKAKEQAKYDATHKPTFAANPTTDVGTDIIMADFVDSDEGIQQRELQQIHVNAHEELKNKPMQAPTLDTSVEDLDLTFPHSTYMESTPTQENIGDYISTTNIGTKPDVTEIGASIRTTNIGTKPDVTEIGEYVKPNPYVNEYEFNTYYKGFTSLLDISEYEALDIKNEDYAFLERYGKFEELRTRFEVDPEKTEIEPHMLYVSSDVLTTSVNDEKLNTGFYVQYDVSPTSPNKFSEHVDKTSDSRLTASGYTRGELNTRQHLRGGASDDWIDTEDMEFYGQEARPEDRATDRELKFEAREAEPAIPRHKYTGEYRLDKTKDSSNSAKVAESTTDDWVDTDDMKFYGQNKRPYTNRSRILPFTSREITSIARHAHTGVYELTSRPIIATVNHWQGSSFNTIGTKPENNPFSLIKDTTGYVYNTKALGTFYNLFDAATEELKSKFVEHTNKPNDDRKTLSGLPRWKAFQEKALLSEVASDDWIDTSDMEFYGQGKRPDSSKNRTLDFDRTSGIVDKLGDNRSSQSNGFPRLQKVHEDNSRPTHLNNKKREGNKVSTTFDTRSNEEQEHTQWYVDLRHQMETDDIKTEGKYGFDKYVQDLGTNLLNNFKQPAATAKKVIADWTERQTEGWKQYLDTYIMDPTHELTELAGNVLSNAITTTLDPSNLLFPFKQRWDPILQTAVWQGYRAIPYHWLHMPIFSPSNYSNITISPLIGNFIASYGTKVGTPIQGPIQFREGDVDLYWNTQNTSSRALTGTVTFDKVTQIAFHNTRIVQEYGRHNTGDTSSARFKGWNSISKIKPRQFVGESQVETPELLDEKVNFGTEFYWDMLFSYPLGNEQHLPAMPYKGWIPVQSWNIIGTQMTSTQVDTLVGQVQLPDSYQLPTSLQIVLPETSYYDVDTWMRAYFASIFFFENTSGTTPKLRILPYKKQTMYITIYWLTEQWMPVRSKTYICIPDFKFQYNGTSDKSLKTQDITFNIVGVKGYSDVNYVTAGGASKSIRMLE